MRTRSWRLILSMLVLLGIALPAVAGQAREAELEILVGTLEANKRAFVAIQMDLDDAEAKAFWEVYDRYEGDLSPVRNRLVGVIEEYTANFETMSDADASRLLEEFLELEREREAVREKYREPFTKVLSGRDTLRFYQIENKIHAVLRYELARDIPVLGP